MKYRWGPTIEMMRPAEFPFGLTCSFCGNAIPENEFFEAYTFKDFGEEFCCMECQWPDDVWEDVNDCAN